MSHDTLRGETVDQLDRRITNNRLPFHRSYNGAWQWDDLTGPFAAATLHDVPGASKSFAARVAAKVNWDGPIPDHAPDHAPELGPCAIWTGATDTRYGIVRVGGRGSRLMRAHHAVWCLFNGEPPAGLEVDHLCRVRTCVRPSHLEWVTHQVNMDREWESRRAQLA